MCVSNFKRKIVFSTALSFPSVTKIFLYVLVSACHISRPSTKSVSSAATATSGSTQLVAVKVPTRKFTAEVKCLLSLLTKPIISFNVSSTYKCFSVLRQEIRSQGLRLWSRWWRLAKWLLRRFIWVSWWPLTRVGVECVFLIRCTFCYATLMLFFTLTSLLCGEIWITWLRPQRIFLNRIDQWCQRYGMAEVSESIPILPF